MTSPTEAQPARRTITLERTWQASLEEVWDLWTTKEGIESWWGPEGFRVEVHKLEPRTGGAFEYAMIAAAAPQIEFMKRAGMPVSHAVHARFAEVTPRRRLTLSSLIDFVPGVAAYQSTARVELEEVQGGVQMRLSIDAMHDDEWTKRSVMGWESQLGKLVQLLAGRITPRTS